MKKLFFILVMLIPFVGLKAQTTNDEIQVVYFHMQDRCATCMAIEDGAKKALDTYFSDDYKSGKIKMLSINIEDNEQSELVKKWKISGSSLFIAKGDKKVNLTNKAFLLARTQPEKYHDALVKAIKSL